MKGSHGPVYPPSEARRSWGVYPCGYGRLRRPAVYTSTTQACLYEGLDSARGLGECLGGALPTIFGKIGRFPPKNTQLHRLPFTGAVGTQVHLCLLFISYCPRPPLALSAYLSPRLAVQQAFVHQPCNHSQVHTLISTAPRLPLHIRHMLPTPSCKRPFNCPSLGSRKTPSPACTPPWAS